MHTDDKPGYRIMPIRRALHEGKRWQAHGLLSVILWSTFILPYSAISWINSVIASTMQWGWVIIGASNDAPVFITIW